jgi:hypothetical protein
MLVDHLEDLRHRFEERKFKLNKEWVNAVEMMSARTLRIEQDRAAYLVVGSRARGWAPDQLLKGPERVVLWSIPGGVFGKNGEYHTRLAVPGEILHHVVSAQLTPTVERPRHTARQAR